VPRPEYPGFNSQVRRPGAAFLAAYPRPTSEQFRKKNFWSRAAKELHAAYSGICAYTATYLPEQGSVDHFIPKTINPALAYEWSNYRLASGRVNSCKGNQTDILDPFQVGNDWFEIDIPSCLLRAKADLPHGLRTSINATINSLRLNTDDYYVQERCNILIDHAKGEITLNFLRRRYPFLAKEIERQNLGASDLAKLFKISQ
jgi:5-methylcytosine-specific restriction endonuclease McrA